MTTAQKLRAKIHSINHPDGIPMGRGTQVFWNDEPKEWAQVATFVGAHPTNGVNYFIEADGSLYHSTKDEYEILGKPLTLQDVLRALKIRGYMYEFDSRFDFNGEIAELRAVLGKSDGCDAVDMPYDLTKEIEDQDEEVLESLIELL